MSFICLSGLHIFAEDMMTLWHKMSSHANGSFKGIRTDECHNQKDYPSFGSTFKTVTEFLKLGYICLLLNAATLKKSGTIIFTDFSYLKWNYNGAVAVNVNKNSHGT